MLCLCVYAFMKKSLFENRKTLILLNYDNNHFESIGKLNNRSEPINEFYPEDPIIRKMHMFIYKPEEVSSYYPFLMKHLPEKYRTKYDKFCSKSPRRRKILDIKDNDSSVDDDVK